MYVYACIEHNLLVAEGLTRDVYACVYGYVCTYVCQDCTYYVLAVVSVYVCTKSGSLSRHMEHHVMYACVYGGSVCMYTHMCHPLSVAFCVG